MKMIKRAEEQSACNASFVCKSSCVGCLCDSKHCSPSCPRVLKWSQLGARNDSDIVPGVFAHTIVIGCNQGVRK